MASYTVDDVLDKIEEEGVDCADVDEDTDTLILELGNGYTVRFWQGEYAARISYSREITLH